MMKTAWKKEKLTLFKNNKKLDSDKFNESVIWGLDDSKIKKIC